MKESGRTTNGTAAHVPVGLGAIRLAGLSLDAAAEEILRRAAADVGPVELWLVDLASGRLVRPGCRGIQRKDSVPMSGGDGPAGWPDELRIPAEGLGAALSRMASHVAAPAVARALRPAGGAPDEMHGYLVARCDGSRPSAARLRRLESLAAEAGALLSNVKALRAAEEKADQLLALYQAAHELSAGLDLDQVLATICARARTLTGAEIAYLMLLDPARGDGYVRATDGVRTEAFKTVRLGLGLGLGGLVARDGRPYYSSDYLHDGRFVHVVDGVVADEGIVSVMGVPLIIESEVIGVLFAAYRRMTTFSNEDVAVLESLAEHAAVALANARLHDQTEKALESEKRLHRIAEQQREALEQVNALHARLTELALAEPGMDDLLSDLGAALGHAVDFRDDPPADGAHVPVAAGATVLGWLCAPATAQLGSLEVLGLEQAARVVAAHMLRERAVVQAQYRLRGEFLDELLTADERSRREIIIRGSYLGVDLTKPLAVLFIVGEEDTDQETRDRLGNTIAELAPGCLVAARHGGGVLLAPGKDPPRAFADRLAERLAQRSKVPFTIGVAAHATGLEGLPDALEEARHAVRGARALGRRGEVVCRDDLGVYGILLLEEGGQLLTFAERLLGPLIAYDRRQGTNLVETLDVYLDAGGNVTEAARRLILHVNSLYYRLNRIRELGSYDLDDPEARFELQLALRAMRGSPPGQ